MGRTLLIGNGQTSWREWLRQHRSGRDLLCLDPADPANGIPARFTLLKSGKPVAARFYGSLDPARAPHVIVAALATLLPMSSENALVQTFAYRPTPLLHQTLLLIAQYLQPESILVACGTAIDQGGFPVGPEEVETERAFPTMVQAAQRKAQWIRMLETCTEQDVDLAAVTVEGARLGAGTPLLPEAMRKAGLDWALYAEKAGNTLFAVTEEDPEEWRVSRTIDSLGAARAHLVHPDAYRGLLCSLARADGEDFGTGIVQTVDWESRTLRILATAVPPAPVRLLRLGTLRLSPDGTEHGELRPWQV